MPSRLKLAGRRAAERLSAFATACRGNVAMIFALSLVPLSLAAGAGIDYARAIVVKTNMSEALDAAALAVGASPGLSQPQMQALAQQYFNANYKVNSAYGTPQPVTVTTSGQSIIVSVSDNMPTTVLKAVGIQTLAVNATSKVVWGQTKLWVALVLDNTGSMSQTDYTGTSKMSALKTASHQLLGMLQNAAINDGDVRVAVIPFARNVKIGTSYNSANWLSWTDFLAPPSSTPSNSVGANSSCPWSDWTNGYHCQVNSTNGSYAVGTIPSNGLICPSGTSTGHYYNGCFNSVGNNNNGNNGGGWAWGWWNNHGNTTYNHTWIPNNTNTWSGCVTDRDQNYDVSNATPTPSTPASMMVAENSPSCPTAAILPLTYSWNTLSSEINAMSPNGSTNQTIGLVWGWHALTQGAPLNPPALPANTQRIIILLSDGLNTQDRWYGNGSSQSSQVDARMALACTNAKADGITIYAVFVDLNGTQGNSSVLENCASDAGKYFDLTTSGQIVSTFSAIGQQITNLRVSQ